MSHSLVESSSASATDPPCVGATNPDARIVAPINNNSPEPTPIIVPESQSPNPKIHDRLTGGIDWDSDDNHQRRFFKTIMDEKRERRQELQMIEQKWQELNLERQDINKQRKDLEVREAEIVEVELLVPLTRQFQKLKLDVTNFIPWMETIQEYSKTHNTDLTTAAFSLADELRDYRQLGGVKRVIVNAEKYLSTLGSHIREKEAAVDTVMKLRAIGYTEGDMKKLMGIVKDGRGWRKLDTELLPDEKLEKIRHSGYNGNPHQQPGQSIPAPVKENNGYGSGPSDNQLIKLSLLKSANIHMRSRLGLC